jgi:hypothetical protein
MAKIVWQMILLRRHDNCGNNISSLATNKSVWQIILLPRHNDRGNNVYSLATEKLCGKWCTCDDMPFVATTP